MPPPATPNEPDSVDPIAQLQAQRAAAAARVRRSRDRRAAGVIRIEIDLDPSRTGLLVNLGFLASGKERDPNSVQAAFEKFLGDAWFRAAIQRWRSV